MTSVRKFRKFTAVVVVPISTKDRNYDSLSEAEVVFYINDQLRRAGSAFQLETPYAKSYFVSGHLDLTEAEFAEHYVPVLQAAIREGAFFVVGDARGCDRMSQEFLRDENVRVFHMLEAPRHNVDDYSTVGGFLNDEDRDAAMTRASHADIAWVRPGRTHSGTARNLTRRAAATKQETP